MTNSITASAVAPAASPALVDSVTRLLALVTTVGAGLVAGVFFAFSTFVMAGLRALPPAQGLSAMQAINKAAPSVAFMLLLFGTTVAGVALAVTALRDLDNPAARCQLIGVAAFLVLVIGTTIAYHVPHNDALAALDPNTPGSVSAWLTYARDWTRWNHVRTAGATLATALFAVSFRVR